MRDALLDRIEAVRDATEGKGGYMAIYRPEQVGCWLIEWWAPHLVCPVWTQERHSTLEDAVAEAAGRLGIEDGA